MGLSRINQSIEVFVNCVLGSQVNVRRSILGSGGYAKDAQREFLVLFEDAMRQPDLAKSVQRYQLAIDESKVRLNLAVCPGAWLMPGNMVINTEAVVGYNNQLKRAEAGFKLGEQGHKKSRSYPNGRRAAKEEQVNQPPFQPNTKQRNSTSKHYY